LFRILNNPVFAKSVVGRVGRLLGGLNRLPPSEPLITRMG